MGDRSRARHLGSLAPVPRSMARNRRSQDMRGTDRTAARPGHRYRARRARDLALPGGSHASTATTCPRARSGARVLRARSGRLERDRIAYCGTAAHATSVFDGSCWMPIDWTDVSGTVVRVFQFAMPFLFDVKVTIWTGVPEPHVALASYTNTWYSVSGARPLTCECSWISPFGIGLRVTSPVTPDAARASN